VNGVILFFANHDASVWDNYHTDPAYLFPGTDYPDIVYCLTVVGHYTRSRDMILTESTDVSTVYLVLIL